MAPTFYHYSPGPMEKTWEKQGPGSRRRWLVAAVLMVLIDAVLVTLLIYFAVRANSEACRDGLRAQHECRNTTHLLQRQLTRAQENLLQAETQANTCNLTVELMAHAFNPSTPEAEASLCEFEASLVYRETLQNSLEKKVSQVLEQQAHIQELEAPTAGLGVRCLSGVTLVCSPMWPMLIGPSIIAGEVMKLNQELATLRTKEEASRTAQNSASSMVVSSLLMFTSASVPAFLRTQ